ncbi:MAG: PilZ domain-containing protein [Planctomycetes bacterium]|nr:PilZ domain-containing protein [Planctomycetota bacterium]
MSKNKKDFDEVLLCLPATSSIPAETNGDKKVDTMSSATGKHGSLPDGRRVYRRFDVSIEGKCSIVSDVAAANGIEFPVTIKNISEGGALFVSQRPLPSGVTFTLSYNPPSKGSAPGYGIQGKRISMEIIRQKEVYGKAGVEYVIVARSIEAKTLLQPEQWKATAKVLKQLLIIKNSAGMLVAKGVKAYEQFFDSILEERGYQVRIANNVQEALSMLGEGCFDAILSDIETVSNDRYELLKVLEYKFPDIDLIITTKSSHEWFNSLLERAEEYIEKLVEGKEINVALEKRLLRLLSEYKDFFGSGNESLRQKVINDLLNRINVLNRIRDAKEGELQGKTQHQRKYFRMYLPEEEQIPCTMEFEFGQVIECTISDLSVEGFGTLLDTRSLNLSPGTLIKDVRIPLPNGDLVKGQAVVRFISPTMESSKFNCGIEFVNLHARFREKISKYIFETHGDAVKKIKGKIDAFC